MRKRNHIKKTILLFTIGLLILNCFFAPELTGGAYPSEVSAKTSGKTKKKAAKAYREFMDRCDYTWFYMAGIGKDGLRELLVYYEQQPETLIIYKYCKGLVRRAGEDHTGFDYYRNRKIKRIHVYGAAPAVQRHGISLLINLET